MALLQSVGHKSWTGSAELIQELAATVAIEGNAKEMGGVFQAVEDYGTAKRPSDFEYALFVGLGRGLASRNKHLSDLAGQHGGVLTGRLETLLQEVCSAARDSEKSDSVRTQALQMLGSFKLADVEATLTEVFEPQNPRAIQFAALRTLGRYSDSHVAELFISRLPEFTPPLRQEMVEVLLSRHTWAEMLVNAIQNGDLLANQVAFAQRGRLLRHPDAKIAAQAKLLFGSDALGPRGNVVAEYTGALKLSADRQRGVNVFRKHCMTCHRIGDAGHDLAPNLATVKHRIPEEILLHVLDPNREVPPQYMNYTVTLKSGTCIATSRV